MPDLDKLERLLAQATHGPWKYTPVAEPGSRQVVGGYVVTANGMRRQVARTMRYSNVDGLVIVALRNAAPELIARLRAAEAVCEAADAYRESLTFGAIRVGHAAVALGRALDEWKAVRGGKVGP